MEPGRTKNGVTYNSVVLEHTLSEPHKCYVAPSVNRSTRNAVADEREISACFSYAVNGSNVGCPSSLGNGPPKHLHVSVSQVKMCVLDTPAQCICYNPDGTMLAVGLGGGLDTDIGEWRGNIAEQVKAILVEYYLENGNVQGMDISNK